MELPNDLYTDILTHASMADIIHLCQTKKWLYDYCDSPHFWQLIFQRDGLPIFPATHFNEWVTMYYRVNKIIRYLDSIELDNLVIIIRNRNRQREWMKLFFPNKNPNQLGIVIRNRKIFNTELSHEDIKDMLIETFYYFPETELYNTNFTKNQFPHQP